MEKQAISGNELDEEKSKRLKKMAQQLDNDLDAFIDAEIEAAKKRQELNPKPERTVKEIMEEMTTHPAFMTEIDYTKPLHPATEALIELEYDTDDAQELAAKYKADGNDNFKRSRYHWAIDNYTEGIKANCSDRLTNAVLHSNRAAANYHIGNYRSALNDTIVARKLVPSHLKAIIRGAQCCFKLKKFDDCQQWCNSGLLVDEENSVLQDLNNLCTKEKKVQEKDRRKQKIAETKQAESIKKLLNTISSRGIHFTSHKQNRDDLDHDVLTCHHPEGRPVHFSDEGVLLWPVMFLYPEYSESDFIQAMNENDRFIDHLDAMFGPSTPPPSWDACRHYTSLNIQVFFKDESADTLQQVDREATLLEALQHKRFTLKGGTPTFIILSTVSPFFTKYLSTNGGVQTMTTAK